jgi:uncharacterized protein (DUF736 family)
MSDYDDTNRGALFKNTKKETDKHPDYRGTVNVGGTEYWISSWLKVAKTGEKYMSLALSEKEEAKPAKKAAPSRVPGDDDEDLPF